MTTLTIRRIAIVPIILALALGAAGQSTAATPARDGAAVKRNVLTVVADLERILATPPSSPGVADGLVEAEATLRGLPDASFANLDPMLVSGLERLRDLAEWSRSSGAQPPLWSQMTSTGFPNADYPDIGFALVLEASVGVPDENGNTTGSQLGVCTTATAPNPQMRFILLNASLLGEALRDTARRLCDQTVIIAGEGANLAPVCIISDIAYLLIRGIQDNMFLCADVMLGAESTGTYARLGHVHDDLAAAQALLTSDITALQTNLTADANANQDLLDAVDSALQAHDQNLEARMQSIMAAIDAINQLLEDFRTLELRIRIESNLADADGKPVGSFLLPEALGGALETVREVTADTIQMVIDTGGEVGNAVKWLAQGDRMYSQGDFAGAFAAYGQAYRAACR